MTALPMPVFKFSSETFKLSSVLVDNIPEYVSRREIVALFNALIGEVRNSQTVQGGSGRQLEITFYTADASKKALCMSGYNVGGLPFSNVPENRAVMPSRPSNFELRSDMKRKETRRNLYVLGLPFGLTKTEFAGIFSRYGTVSHCVILATVDNASRRRGFVVMSSPEEAKLALSSLSRTQIKGHILDISWAVVQRSQGFLDGGDRTMMLDSQSVENPSSDIIKHHSANPPDQSVCARTNEHDLSCYTSTLVPTSSLLVTNLPTMLFSQTVDLHPLFCPFGHIKCLDIMESLPVSGLADKISVIVEYETLSSAQDAKETLQGQCYTNYTLNVEFVQTNSHAKLGSSVSAHTTGLDANLESTYMSYLNPFAPPFTLEAPQPGIIAGSLASYLDTPKTRDYYKAQPKIASLYASPQLFSYANFRLPMARMASRSSSTTSRGSNDSFLGPLHEHSAFST